ncbi:ABC transporter ATP-binding protein [Micropruina glycogenica]|uniref:Fatty acid ABC transporter ATP-binding/permease protein n=1 Tax=Micropruina glycogenica TaxID=75385 RepID=A0A2N9JI28_9ACTN|nr:ABC transporter ATP-binding protein [Micropruina glycogenica]SPD87730.1 putative ABC transporter (ATP-binding protein) [Micropruina glycogenica]
MTERTDPRPVAETGAPNPDAHTSGVPRTANERPKHGPQRGMGHGPMQGLGSAEKAVSFVPSAKRLLGMMRPERNLIIVVIVISALATLGNAIGPAILAQGTDLIFAGATGGGIDFAALATVIWQALGVYVIAGVVLWFASFLINDIVQRTVYRMREMVATKLNRLPITYFDGQPRGELLSRVTNDIDNIAQSLQQTLAQMLNNIFTVIGVLALMFWLSPPLALVVLISVPLTVLVTAQVMKRSQKRFADMWRATGQVNSEVEEAFTGHSLVKVFGRQREVAARFAERNNEMFDASFRAQFISGIVMPAVFFIGNLSYVLIAVIGGVWVAAGTMTLGAVQAFIQYSRMFTQPITQLASMTNLLQSGVASAERVFEVMDAPEQSADGTESLPVPLQGRVDFDHVSFSYDPEKPLITDLSLIAEPGATVAIVGPTGAGKTTLVNLLMRFYEVDAGRITIDGVNIADVPRPELRANIGMVLQDAWLFGGTIRDNIAYGRPTATEAEILAAAEATYVDRFVHSLPDGYDTVIDDEGSNVSAGEKQLITIARAFLSDPAILILDEATSSVDTRTELLVQQAMQALRGGRTSFVIAHRLSTIRDADTILVMENGAIVEQGSHEALLAARGAYARLYRSQFAGGLDDDEDEAA